MIASSIVGIYFYYKINFTWDGGIDYNMQTRLRTHCEFDPNKEILYVSRRVVGIWINDENIKKTKDFDIHKDILKSLSSNYNLILYVPVKDKNKVSVYNLNPSINFIIDNKLPICFITQHMPVRIKTEPFSINNESLWFIRYKKEEDKYTKWEEYM